MTESQTDLTDDHIFVTLVTDLVTQAWVSLGKIKHPATDKIERNIPAASMIIDMLDMLNRKTDGNRSEMEDQLLKDSLQQLKINYVAEAEKPEAPAEESSEEVPTEVADESGSADPDEAREESSKDKESQSDQSPEELSEKNDA
ncbi:DUF1844 domain-containing protein [Candidatus Neomarinimicrobiota bacterium]